MNIDWASRLKNKSFVLALISALLLCAKQAAVMFGYDIDLTLFGENLNAMVEAVFTLLGVIGVTGVVMNPTTPGVGDGE